MTNEIRTKFFSIFAEAAYDQGSSIKMENYIKEKYPSADKIAVIDKTPDDGGSGLYAEAWLINNEIVISIKGTDFDSTVDWINNIGLGTGLYSSQQWAELKTFIQDILDQYSGLMPITLTGHSLGGGLASLAAVQFGLPAYTFAPAPFKVTTLNNDFVPVGLTKEYNDILEAKARGEYVEQEKYVEAHNAKMQLINERLEVVKDFSVKDEVLQIIGFRFNEFPIQEPNLIDIGLRGSGEGWMSSTADAVARHGMGLHMALANSRNFTSLIKENEHLRKFLLNGYFSPQDPIKYNSMSSDLLLRALLHEGEDYRKLSLPSFTPNALKEFMTALTLNKLSNQITYGDYIRNGNKFTELYETGSIGITYDLSDIIAADIAENYPGSLPDAIYLLSSAFQESILKYLLSQGRTFVDSMSIAKSAEISESPETFHLQVSHISTSHFWYESDGRSDFVWSLSNRDSTYYLSDDGNNIHGTSRSEIFVSGAGSDIIFGGANGSHKSDTIDYSRSTSSVDISLDTAGPQKGGYAEGDILIGIENIIGSHFDDILVSSYNGSLINAGSGDDYIVAKGNNQKIFGGDGNDRIIAIGTSSIIDGGSGFDIAYVNSIYSAKYLWVAEGDRLRPAIEINGNTYMGIDEFRIGYNREQNFEHIYTPGSGSFNLSWAQMIDYIYNQNLDASAKGLSKGTVGSIRENVELDVLYRYNLKENPNLATFREIVAANMTIPGVGIISLIVDHIGDELVLRAPQGITVDAEVTPYALLYFKFSYTHVLKWESSSPEFTNVYAYLAVLNVYDNGPTQIFTDNTSFEINKDFENFKISLSVDKTDIDHRSITWDIASDPSSLFYISGNQLMLKGYDYVKFKDSVTITIRASDGKTILTKDVTFSVQNAAPNLYEPLFETTISYFDVGATLITIPFSDDHDSVEDLVWEIIENPFNENGEPSIPNPDDLEREPLFAIVGNKVMLLRSPNQSELGTSIGISIKVTDRSGSTSEKTIVVKLPNSYPGGSETGENPGSDNASPLTTYGTEDGDVLTGTDSPDVIYGLGGNDIITAVGSGDILYGGDGDDILIGDIDSVLYGEDGNDILMATAVGHLYSGSGDDTFDISNVVPGAKTGIIDGGTGYDIVYVKDFSTAKLTLTGQTVNLLVNGFAITDVEEYRVGWEKDANGIWSEAAYSQTISCWDLFAKAAIGEIEGLNAGWQNITVAAINESLEKNVDRIVVFQGELKSALPNGIVISDSMVTMNGVNYAAQVTVTNGVYTITLPKIVIADVTQHTVYEGELLSRDTNGILTKQGDFTGLIRDVYDLQNAPTHIIGTSIIDPTGVDTFDPVQFDVDHFNVDKPITWTLSGSGSEFFTISNEGILSSTASTDFSVSYELIIEATDGVKSVVKNIYINPYSPINVIFGTNADDIINGTAKDDIIHGLEGDDTIYVGGGFDTVYGGAGNDTIIASDNYVDLYGEDGNDILIGSLQDDYLYGGDGDDIIYGGGHKDRMWGGSGADVFVYKNVTDSDYENLDLSDRIFDLEDIDSFDFTEMGDVSFDWDNGPAGSLYVEVNWQPDRNYGYLSIDVDRDGVFDMAIDFDVGAAGLTQINFVNGPTYYLDNGSTANILAQDDLLVQPIADNSQGVYNEYQWAA